MRSHLTKLLDFVGLTGQATNRNTIYAQHDVEQNIKFLPVAEIELNSYRLAVEFNEEDLRRIAKSIEQYGVIQPLVVRRKLVDGYELIIGERSLKACKLIGLERVPAIVGDFTAQEALELLLFNNCQQQSLSFLEEAIGYQILVKKFGMTRTELSEKLGLDLTAIDEKLDLLELPVEVLKLINDFKLTEGQAQALLRLSDKDSQINVIKQIIEQDYTVKELDELITELKQDLGESEDNKQVIKYFNDVRLAVNTIRKMVADVKASGLSIAVEERECAEYVEFNIRLPKK
ncbi:MAG: ParB/RepB/Spo0J family partition protein [Bacillota bacterium]